MYNFKNMIKNNTDLKYHDLKIVISKISTIPLFRHEIFEKNYFFLESDFISAKKIYIQLFV